MLGISLIKRWTDPWKLRWTATRYSNGSSDEFQEDVFYSSPEFEAALLKINFDSRQEINQQYQMRQHCWDQKDCDFQTLRLLMFPTLNAKPRIVRGSIKQNSMPKKSHQILTSIVLFLLPASARKMVPLLATASLNPILIRRIALNIVTVAKSLRFIENSIILHQIF